jgi:hypothetical protein
MPIFARVLPVVFSLIALSHPPALACECAELNLSQAWWSSELVVRVKVSAWGRTKGGVVYTAVWVQKTYNGCAKKSSWILLESPDPSSGCAPSFAPGDILLVAANAGAGKGKVPTWAVDACSFVVPWSDLSSDQLDWIDRQEKCCDGACGCQTWALEVTCDEDPCAADPCAQGECTFAGCGECVADWIDAEGYPICQPCAGDGPCVGPGQHCLPSAKCEVPKSCKSFSCPNACGDDAACVLGDGPESNWCVDAPLCTTDADCPPGGTCRSMNLDCTPVQKRCALLWPGQKCNNEKGSWANALGDFCGHGSICPSYYFFNEFGVGDWGAYSTCMPVECHAAGDCPPGEWCQLVNGSDGICREDGQCMGVDDCDLPDNDSGKPSCAGTYATCGGSCTWHCPPSSCLENPLQSGCPCDPGKDDSVCSGGGSVIFCGTSTSTWVQVSCQAYCGNDGGFCTFDPNSGGDWCECF